MAAPEPIVSCLEEPPAPRDRCSSPRRARRRSNTTGKHLLAPTCTPCHVGREVALQRDVPGRAPPRLAGCVTPVTFRERLSGGTRILGRGWGGNSLQRMRPDELKRRLQDSTLSRRPRRALHVLMLPDLERAERIWGGLELPAEPHVRRTPDRLRGKTGRSERCSSGCCGRLSARATRTPKPLPTAPGDRPISRRRRASGACCGARDLRRHHPFGARSACTSSSSRNLATSRASFLVSSRSSASSAVAAVIPSRAFALPSLKKCLN